MTINADTLLDRIYLKSQITRWRMLAIFFAAVAAIVAISEASPHSPIEKEFVARISLEGIIGDDQDVYALIDEVAENPKAKAAIIWLDSPGGSAVGGEEIYTRLRALAAKKPVVAVMRSVGASAGYMVALGTDYIIAREGTITGSIGVLVETVEVTELANKLGIKPVIVKSAPLKGSPNPLEKTSPESERVLEEMIHDFYNRFVDMVTERRQLPREKVIALADGRVYSGRKALDEKLIDALGGEQEAMQWLIKQRKMRKGLEIEDVTVDEKLTVVDKFMRSTIGKIFQKSSVTLDGLVAVWHPQLH